MIGTYLEQINDFTFTLKKDNDPMFIPKINKINKMIRDYELALLKPIAICSSLNFTKSGDLRHAFFGTTALPSGKMLDIQSIIQPLLKYQIGIDNGYIYQDEEFTVLSSADDFLYELPQLKNIKGVNFDYKETTPIYIICCRTSKPLTFEKSKKKLDTLFESMRNKIKLDAASHTIDTTDLLASAYVPDKNINVLKQIMNSENIILLPVLTICQSFEIHVQDEVRLFSRYKLDICNLQRFINSLKISI